MLGGELRLLYKRHECAGYADDRMTIQSAINERYPKFVIARLFEMRKGDQITYFAYLKPKPGIND